MDAAYYSNCRFKLRHLQTDLPWTLYYRVCLVCCARQEDKVLVWRLEGVGGRGDFLFELCGVEKKTNGCKILLRRVKKMSRLSALHSPEIELV